MAKARPAVLSISKSLKLSPNAIVWLKSMPKCSLYLFNTESLIYPFGIDFYQNVGGLNDRKVAKFF